MTVRVLVVDDHRMVLDGIVAAINSDPDLRVVGSATCLAEAIDVISDSRPDVVVTDFQLSDGLGTQLVGAVGPTGPRFLVVTGHDPRPVMAAVMASDCAGFMTKDFGHQELLRAVKAVASGAAIYPAELLRQSMDGSKNNVGRTLTQREMEVLNMLAQAKAVGTIAEELFVSEHTVKNHIRNVLAKLNARNQLEAVVVAAQAGLVVLGRR